MTDDEKTEKHRMIVRRAYYQKKALKAELRDEIARLEAAHQQLVEETNQLQPHTADADNPENSDAGCVITPTVQQLRTKYRSLSIANESLRAQRSVLEEQLLQHQVFTDKRAQYLQVAYPSYPTCHTISNHFHTDPHVISVTTAEFPVWFKPLDEADCFSVIRTAVLDIQSQISSNQRFQTVGARPIMGWTRKRTFGGTTTNFSLLKTFPNQSARTLWNTTWRLYTESRLFEQLYSGAVDMRFHVLQRVNDRNVLFCRTLKTDKLAIRNATFFLFSRFQVQAKRYILFRSIGNDRVHAAYPEDAVIGMFSWFCLTDTNDTSCVVEFGGTVPSASVADTDFWMMEFLSYMLRLENRTVGPAFQILH